MNKELIVDQTQINLLYKHYKNYLVPFVMLITAALLVWYFVIPQFQELQEMKKQEETLRAKNEILKKNILFLQNLPNLDEKLDIATKALPADKDYIGILLSVPSIATDAKISVDDFSFTVGELSSSQSAKARSTSTNSSLSETSSNTDLSLDIKGSEEGEKAFLEALTKTFPLASATEIEFSSADAATVKAVYYSLPLPDLKFVPEQLLPTLTAKDNALLDEITNWKKPVVVAPASPTPATSSAGVTPSPVASQSAGARVITPATTSAVRR